MTTPTSGPISLSGNVGAEFRLGQTVSLSGAAAAIGCGNSLSQMRGQTYQNGSNCVATTSFFTDGRQARDVTIGDYILAIDYSTMTTTKFATIERHSIAFQPCVRITSASGITLVASVSTPVTYRDHSMALITECVGHELPVQDEAGFRWERIVAIDTAGMREVAHIFAGHATFAAGEKPNAFIFTHNIKQ